MARTDNIFEIAKAQTTVTTGELYQTSLENRNHALKFLRTNCFRGD